MYSIEAPICLRESTNIFIGRLCILSDPINRTSVLVVKDKYEAKNLIAVPA